ncbi:MAG TPA: HDOD domain-containing protein [Gallionella sp.]|nr:HDOD domain-containing protein [Gallionella sp.]
MSCNALEVDGVSDKLFFVDADILNSGSQLPALPFPASRLVIQLNKAFLANSSSAETCAAWRKQGARLAVAGLDLPPGHTPDSVGIHFLHAATAHDTLSEKTLLDASRSGARLFAQGIGSTDLFQWCTDAGFGYFALDGLDPPAENGESSDSSRLPLMRLLSLVAMDADAATMEEVFKLDPKLAFELLRLVNSASFGIRTEITSFSQAIMVLGRRQLQRWLQLLMFSLRKDGDDSPNILMQRAAERGKIMEALARKGNETADPELAFMVGVFSVLDVLMSTPLAELLKSVSLPQPVLQALLERKGRLGALLDLICATEHRDFAEMQRLLQDLAIEIDTLSTAQLDAVSWSLKVIGSK